MLKRIFTPIILKSRQGFLCCQSFWSTSVANQIAITERRFFGAELARGRVFSIDNEVGLKADYLSPGLFQALLAKMMLGDKAPIQIQK